MKRRRSLVAGVACGCLCAVFVALFLYQVESAVERDRAAALERYGGEQVEVCVAVRDIAAGETVGSSDVKVRSWLVEMLPEGALLSLDEVVGRRASADVLSGEVLVEKRFEAQSEWLEVPDGFTAVSLPARDVQAVGGALTEGARIDVYATGNTSTRAIARDVLVLATSAESQGGLLDSSSQWITIAAQPSCVQELISAAQTLELYFALPGKGVQANLDEESDDLAPVGRADGNDIDESEVLAEDEGANAASLAGERGEES